MALFLRFLLFLALCFDKFNTKIAICIFLKFYKNAEVKNKNYDIKSRKNRLFLIYWRQTSGVIYFILGE